MSSRIQTRVQANIPTPHTLIQAQVGTNARASLFAQVFIYISQYLSKSTCPFPFVSFSSPLCLSFFFSLSHFLSLSEHTVTYSPPHFLTLFRRFFPCLIGMLPLLYFLLKYFSFALFSCLSFPRFSPYMHTLLTGGWAYCSLAAASPFHDFWCPFPLSFFLSFLSGTHFLFLSVFP